MIINQFRTPLRPALLSLVLAASTLGVTATPSQAGIGDFFGCFFGCYGGGGGGGGSYGGGGGGGEVEEVEEVDATGIIHTVFIVGDAFFPTEVHASPGDELKFYNLRSSSIRVAADDDSWTSDYMSKDESWSLILQENTELQFRKKSYGYSYMQGEVFLEDPPASVAYADLIDANGNVIGKDGETAYVAEGLGYTLAAVSGTMQDVGQGLVDSAGNALGLTDDFGVGNN